MHASVKFFAFSVLLLVLSVVFLMKPVPVSADAKVSVPGGPSELLSDGGDVGPAETAQDHFMYLPALFHRDPPLPYAPELAPISVAGLFEPYTLTWRIDVSDIPVSHYVIQVSDDINFVNPIAYTSTITEYRVTGYANRVYYYRVQAYNTWGSGPWSNIESVQFLTYRDNFNDPSTGWAPRRTSSPDLDLMTLSYTGHEVETMVADMFDFAIFSPMVPALPKPYRIRLMTKIRHEVNEVSYGIVFGGNQGDFCGVTRASAKDPNGCFSHYYRLNAIWAGGYMKYNVSRVDEHGDRGQGVSEEVRGFVNVVNRDPDDWHTWDIWVYEDRFGLSVNGKFIAWMYDTTYLAESYYGIFSSTFEYNFAHFAHTLYYVEPITEDLDPPSLP